jgi:hypothetical protein
MTNAEREFFVSRICAGYVKCPVMNHNFRIYPPNDEIAYEANSLMMDVIESCDALTEDDIMFYLIDHDEWDLNKENKYNSLQKEIEDVKVNMFESTFRSKLREKLREDLNKLTAEYNELSAKRGTYYYLTTDGIALSAKSYYIIENCTYLDGKLYDWSNVPVINVIAKYNSILLSDAQLRELSRTDPWLSLWNIKKQNGKIFDEPFSYEQKQLILYSRFYDSINESPERPSQEVIDDDDLLDGWLIVQKRKRLLEPEKFTNNPKIANADEIFIVAETGKDIQKINNMNNVYGDHVKQKRIKTLENRKDMSWLEFADVKEKMMIEKTRLERETFRKK